MSARRIIGLLAIGRRYGARAATSAFASTTRRQMSRSAVDGRCRTVFVAEPPKKLGSTHHFLGERAEPPGGRIQAFLRSDVAAGITSCPAAPRRPQHHHESRNRLQLILTRRANAEEDDPQSFLKAVRENSDDTANHAAMLAVAAQVLEAAR